MIPILRATQIIWALENKRTGQFIEASVSPSEEATTEVARILERRGVDLQDHRTASFSLHRETDAVTTLVEVFLDNRD